MEGKRIFDKKLLFVILILALLSISVASAAEDVSLDTDEVAIDNNAVSIDTSESTDVSNTTESSADVEGSNVCSSENTPGAVGENNEKLASSYNTVLDDDLAIDYSGEIRSSNDLAIDCSGVIGSSDDLAIDYSGEIKNVVGASGGEDLLGASSAIFKTITITNAIYGEDLKVTVNVANARFLNSAWFFVYLRQGSTVLDEQYKKTDYEVMTYVDVVFTFEFSKFQLTPGIEYNIYLLDATDSDNSMTQKFTVSKADPTGTVSGTEITYGQTETVTASVPTNYAGTITFKLSTGEEETATINGNTATATFDGLKEGEYTVTAEYSGDTNYYKNSITSSTFKVSKITPTFVLINPSGLKAGESGTINLGLTEGMTGNITVTVADNSKYSKTYEYNDTTFSKSLDIITDKLAAGKYYVTATYSGDDKYSNATIEKIPFEVGMLDTPLELDAPSVIDINTAATISVKLPVNATGSVTITVNSKSYTVDAKDGIATITTDVFNTAGTYEITAKYDGDTNYTTNTTTGSMVVRHVIYVDYDNGVDTNAGDSWETAVKTISKANGIISNYDANIPAVIYLANTTHFVDSQIIITRQVTIIGQNASRTIITNKMGGYGLFNFTADANNVEIYNCTFANNKGVNTTENTIISNAGANFTIGNSTFINNTLGSVEGKVGMIHNTGANFTVFGSNFVNNTASYGSIRNYGANFIVFGSNFANLIASEGGAIYTTGIDGIIANSTFINNSVNYGGSIYAGVDSVNLTIVNSTFTNNNATYNGGAICMNGANSTIMNSNFTNNNALKNIGGAIYMDGANSMVINSTFTNNNASYYGGAIRVGANSMVINSTFTNNNALVYGGAIYSTKENLTVANSIFTNNSAIYEGGTTLLDRGNGGAIYNTGANLTVDNSTFTNNMAYNGDGKDSTDYGNGGAIYNKGANFKVTDSTFTNNNCTGRGGAIDNRANNLSVVNSIFTGNNATKGYGGAINVFEGFSTFSLVNSNFTGNNALYAGAVRNNANNVSVINSTFISNNASSYGGAFYNYNGNNVSVINSTFINNTAADGGAIKNSGQSTTVGVNFTVINSRFTNNTANTGGAIRNDKSGFSVFNSTFTGNNASAGCNGGAIYNEGINSKIVNSTFIANNGPNVGGAIYNEANNLTVSNSNFTENNGGNIGGAIYNSGVNCTVSNSTFEGNVITNVGGAIGNEGLNFTVENSTFKDNSVTKSYGGAIWNNAGNISIKNSTFEHNVAAGDWGGAISNFGTNATIINSIFTKNTATNGGGAIYSKNDININNSTFVNNSAIAGGAVYIAADAKSNINDSNFESNKATGGYDKGRGGAIYNAGNVSIANSTFTKNSAGSHGGAISMTGAQAGSVVNSTFNENSAVFGGAINNKETHGLVIDNCTFTKNNATSGAVGVSCGGVIDNDKANNVVINNSIFKANNLINDHRVAQGGNTIYNTGVNLTIGNCTFDSNVGYSDGTIRNSGVNLTVVDSLFKSNKVNYGNGGAIYNIANGLRVDNTTFELNTGAIGGAIYNKASDAVIKNSTFKKNTATDKAIIYNDAGSNLTIQNSTFEDNSVENNGKGIVAYNQNNAYLTLENNTYSAVTGITHIYNEGTLAKVNITVLGNTTHNVTYNQIITLFANITSDGASVAGQDLYFTLNTTDNKYKATSYDNGTYIANYTVKNMGNAIVSADYGGSISAATLQNVSTGLLNASKGYTDLNVTVENITVGKVEFIIIHVANDAEGTVTLTLNDTNKYNVTQSIYNGTVTFPIKDLAVGNYSVNVTYNGSPLYYNKTNDTATFKVSKLDPDFRVDVVNIIYGSNATIIINLPTSVNGEKLVNLTVNGSSYLVNIENGKGELVLSNLGVGVYNIVANFTGDANYSNKTIESKFEVTQYSAALDVLIDNVTYGKISTITAILTGPNSIGLNGTVTVVIINSNGTKITKYVTVKNGRGELPNDILTVGEYTFKATWNENSAANNNYTVSTDSGKFNVTKANIYIDVDAFDVIYGKETTIKVNLSEKVTGTVTVKIDSNTVGSISVTDGVGEGTYSGYKAGNHSVEVSFIDANGNYNSTSDKCNFTVFKADSTIKVTVPTGDITFGDLSKSITINLEGVSGGALPEGTVTVIIDGKTYKGDVELANKDDFSYRYATVALDTILTPGKHNICVIYDGDDNYTGARVDDKFINVVKATPILNVVVGRFDASSNVYSNNVYYNETFTVYVTALDGIYLVTGGEPVKLNGTVVFMINGTKYAVNVTDGVGSTTGIKLPAGTYSYNATWEGNENYTGVVVNNKEFTVNKIQVPVNITAENIVFGDDETITVRLPSDATGDITIEVWHDTDSNPTYYNSAAKLVNGIVTYVIPDLRANSDNGKYTIKFTYSKGNNYYLDGYAEESFTVARANSTLNVAIGNVLYGEIAPINATLTGVNNIGLTGNVAITVYNSTGGMVNSFSFAVTDGNNYSNILNDLKLDAGNYTFKATWTPEYTTSYDVDFNYNASSIGGSFVVYRSTPFMNITGIPVIYVGDNEEIIVNLPTDALSNPRDLIFEIKHNNADYSTYEDYTFNNGYYVLSNLEYGNYSLIVKYKGNNDYFNTSASYNFIVSKINKNITLATGNIKYGSDASVKITLPDGIAGEVEVYVDGKKLDESYPITPEKDSVSISNLGVGSHSVEVVYKGNDKYFATTGVCNFNVTKANSALNVSIADINYNNSFIIKVNNLTGVNNEKLSGSVIVRVNGVDYVVYVTYGEGSTTGIKLPAKEYDFSATYEGNDNYTCASDLGKFIVNKISATFDIAGENITYGDDETITVKLPGDITGSVTITVTDKNGNSYNESVDIKNGVATKTFAGLNVNEKYTIKVEYVGDDNYKEFTNEDKYFSVVRANSTLNVVVGDVDYRQTSNVEITLNGVNNEKITDVVKITIYDENGDVAKDDNGRELKDVEVTAGDNPNPIKLAAGTYNFIASYGGNNNYNSSENKGSFVVRQIIPTIDVNGTPFIYGGDDETITITLPDDVTGKVNVTFNGETNTYSIGEAKSITFKKVDVGNYTVEVTYLGDKNFTSASATYEFTVLKINPELNITTNVIVYGDNETISVKLPGDVNGYVNLTVDGKYYTTINLEEGVGSVNVTNLSAGLHYFVFNYSGDVKYNEVNEIRDINVIKANPVLNVTIEDILYNNILKISATLDGVYNEKLSGIVAVNIGGKKYFVEITNGEGILEDIKLSADKYNFTAVWDGNNNYNNTNFTGSFNVGKINVSAVDISKSNITFGENETIIVTLPGDITGNVTIKVDNDYYSVAIINGVAKKVITGLNAGNHILNITYGGDNNYNEFSNSTEFNVAKADPVLDVTIDNVYCNEVAIITGLLTGVNDRGLTADVNITINNTPYTVSVVNGKIVSKQLVLGAGVYNFTAFWSGNNNYNNVTTKGTFTVSKITPNMTLTADDVVFNQNISLNTVLPNTATGNITIFVDGKYYSNVILDGGFVNELIKGLDAGKHNISVTYNGDDKYTTDVASKIVNVFNADPSLNVVIGNVKYGEIFNIDAFLTGANGCNLNGNVIVIVNNVLYTVEVVDGKGSLSGVKLDKGTYNFTAYYDGAKNYNSAQDNGSFVVGGITKDMYINVDDINVGEDAIITVTLPKDATNNVNITVNGVTYCVKAVNGIATKVVSNLSANYYVVEAYYPGDNNYGAMSTKDVFTVSKIDTLIDITTGNIVFGENETITINLPKDAKGSVNITVKGESYILEVENGKVNKTISGLNAGTHDVSVKYTGDDKYSGFEAVTDFDVAMASSDLDVVISDVKVGENITIKATLTDVNSNPLTGNVIVFINGKTYTVEVIDGEGSLPSVAFDNQANITFVARWEGTNNYNGSYIIDSFEVSKFTDYNMTIDEIGFIKTGGNATINVNVPKDATGNITISINNNTYSVPIKDGLASLNVTDLSAGTYNIVATYEGNNKYDMNKATTTVKVNDGGYYMDVVVPNDVKYGENATIVVNLPTNATGNVTVKVGNKTYKTVVNNGSASITTDKLDAGSYNIVATYDGDDNYLSNNVNSNLEVSKINDYNMTVDIPGEIKTGENTTIKVDVPKDATGNVTVSVDGKNYTGKVENGTASVIIPSLDTGVHNITITYSGDDKYASTINNGTISVESSDVNLTAKDVVMLYRDGTRLVAVLLDARGNPIANATLTFAINGIKYNRTTDANGSASIAINLEYGTYNATISYVGDDNKSASVNVTVTIKSSIIGQDLVKMWRNGTQFYATFLGVGAKPLANTNVTFNINGVFYTKATNENGTAKLNINLDPGSYILTAYNPVSGEQRGYNVLVKPLIETSDLTKYYINGSRFEAKVYNYDGTFAANKTVTFNINGKFYTKTADENGTVSLAINLRPGNYIITSMYEGLSIGNSVEVLPTLETSDLSMTYNDGSEFKVKTLDGQGNPLANQNITFNVNGVFYYKTTGDDGVASLNINLMKGKYIITSYWNDFQIGNKISIS